MDRTESFPRRQARTRRFTLGEPRDFRVSDDGSRVTFLRSSGPVDSANSLWVLDVASGMERLVADPRLLGPDRDEQDLPAAERARRERVRETGSGIVSYDADAGLVTAVFSLGGRLWRADLTGGDRALEPLASQPDAFDPRLAPDGFRVAYVAGPALRVTGDAAGDRVVAGESGDTVSWGSAEFVAAEEMGRTRGHWWSPDSRRLLAARVDTAGVPSWWIADPASPGIEPASVRYPAAGEANAEVRLAVLDIDAGDRADADGGSRDGGAGPGGSGRVDVAWDEDGWEYLAGVRWSDDGLLLTVQTRDQRTLGILEVDPGTGACRLLRRVTDAAWVDLVPGVPRLAGSRLVTVEDRGAAKRLCVDGEALTPDDMQVRAVHHIDVAGVVVTASVDPAETHVAHLGWDGAVERLTAAPGVHGVAAGGDTTVHISRSMDRPGRRCTMRSARREGPDLLIQSHAAEPGLELNVEILELGPRRLTSALVMPAGPAGTGDGPLPVLLDPYGGPHAQRVQRAEALFHTSQWFADQGFAVLVVDGRATPGRGPDFERAVRGDLAGPVLEDQIDALHGRWGRHRAAPRPGPGRHQGLVLRRLPGRARPSCAVPTCSRPRSRARRSLTGGSTTPTTPSVISVTPPKSPPTTSGPTSPPWRRVWNAP